LRENRSDLIVIFFRDEVVKAGLGLQQCGVESRLRGRRWLSSEPTEEWKGQAPHQEAAPWELDHCERLQLRISQCPNMGFAPFGNFALCAPLRSHGPSKQDYALMGARDGSGVRKWF
jgi:hypothetical protein